MQHRQVGVLAALFGIGDGEVGGYFTVIGQVIGDASGLSKFLKLA